MHGEKPIVFSKVFNFKIRGYHNPINIAAFFFIEVGQVCMQDAMLQIDHLIIQQIVIVGQRYAPKGRKNARGMKRREHLAAV